MRIKEARLQNGISQKELATAIGVAQNTLSQYENGKREADYDTILKISEILNCPIDYLIRGEDGENHINRIAELREERNLSQQELALIIGVTPNAVSNWEMGIKTQTMVLLKKWRISSTVQLIISLVEPHLEERLFLMNKLIQV